MPSAEQKRFFEISAEYICCSCCCSHSSKRLCEGGNECETNHVSNLFTNLYFRNPTIFMGSTSAESRLSIAYLRPEAYFKRAFRCASPLLDDTSLLTAIASWIHMLAFPFTHSVSIEHPGKCRVQRTAVNRMLSGNEYLDHSLIHLPPMPPNLCYRSSVHEVAV